MPAAKAPTTRGARISRVRAWTRTSTNCGAEGELDAVLQLGAAGQRRMALVELRQRRRAARRAGCSRHRPRSRRSTARRDAPCPAARCCRPGPRSAPSASVSVRRVGAGERAVRRGDRRRGDAARGSARRPWRRRCRRWRWCSSRRRPARAAGRCRRARPRPARAATPSRSAAVSAIDGIGAGADLVRRGLHLDRALRASASRARSPAPIWVG